MITRKGRGMGVISKAFEGIDEALLLVMKSWTDIEWYSYRVSFGWMFFALAFENIYHKFSLWKLHWCDTFAHMY